MIVITFAFLSRAFQTIVVYWLSNYARFEVGAAELYTLKTDPSFLFVVLCTPFASQILTTRAMLCNPKEMVVPCSMIKSSPSFIFIRVKPFMAVSTILYPSDLCYIIACCLLHHVSFGWNTISFWSTPLSAFPIRVVLSFVLSPYGLENPSISSLNCWSFCIFLGELATKTTKLALWL